MLVAAIKPGTIRKPPPMPKEPGECAHTHAIEKEASGPIQTPTTSRGGRLRRL